MAASDLQVRKGRRELLTIRDTVCPLCIYMGREWFKIFSK
jgi:hypothetical protein